MQLYGNGNEEIVSMDYRIEVFFHVLNILVPKRYLHILMFNQSISVSLHLILLSVWHSGRNGGVKVWSNNRPVLCEANMQAITGGWFRHGSRKRYNYAIVLTGRVYVNKFGGQMSNLIHS